MARDSVRVEPEESGQTLAALLRLHLPVAGAELRRLAEQGWIEVDGQACRDLGRRVHAGQRVSWPRVGRRRAEVSCVRPLLDASAIRYLDDAIVVVAKPPGLTTMRHPHEAAEFGARARRFLPRTLAELLPPLIARRRPGPGPRLRAVHRLDKDTSGLVVFARTPAAERHLGQQFRAHTIERRYWAIVRGQACDARLESWLVRDRGDGRRGSAPQPGHGQRAITHVKVLERLGNFTLVECRLETGRTHQVRIHLGEAGTPICGERIYDRPVHGAPLADPSHFPRVALHAVRLGLVHPVTGKFLVWEAPLPDDMKQLLDSLRRRSS
ncbi:MAG: RluA family pseudouridine synthase [Gemmataceae bacterium]|nr:RluA family pseudouridine synthase [Gemmataceae bacterium]MDW8266470.1 RluA family pseudouridine synthase [Gemmataceae bacterium]